MSDTGRQSPTLQSVADLAGVHRSTASRALNPATSHMLAADVVERIRLAASSLGYRRDALAAGLRTGRSRLVGVVVPDIANPVFGPILRGIESALSEQGHSVLVANAGQEEDGQAAIVEEFIGRRVDGLILATARRDDPVLSLCLAAGVPTVLVNRLEQGGRVSAVVSDDRAGMRMAVAHLVGLGHRRIGHLAGPQHLSTGLLRREGFGQGLAEAGLPPGPVEVASAYTREAGEQAAAALLRRADLTAIVAANDLLALGAYRAAQALGLRRPGDLSIVGHNDMPLVDMVEPPLTTVRIRHQEMGLEAARLLLREIAERGRAPSLVVTEPLLIVRGSTAAPAPIR
ncbi:LacI family DNA-binding transcriptional regulator [Alsobacter sp. KACC 23698]|uniref:LacI family DNA-binding transcriptional regulator n=1 Tax=Alsobacter sp. KACC 23698 TaxID=3149229 RepID=A0AAU7J9H1_9HYPH